MIFWENVTNLNHDFGGKMVWDCFCSHFIPHTPKYERKSMHFHMSTKYKGLCTVAIRAPPLQTVLLTGSEGGNFAAYNPKYPQFSNKKLDEKPSRSIMLVL